jgi:hypothetical protein
MFPFFELFDDCPLMLKSCFVSFCFLCFKITVCSNYLTIQDEVNQVVIHELIHAYDECRAKNLDWTNCAHHACSEVITILDQTFDILLSKYLIGFGVCVFFNRFVQVI